ncbi:YwqG family protein [Actinomadura madurae]|uniref:DUF1963 domain-containing protein n=1 Tax=Actinomadura madurae TaxID=1993 RepID=UPI0020273101|nr:DUF1963 domain-containing protein [Actinomadura madurae]URM94918.1 YwqG family protein [Actinomadura madurae]
MSDTPDSGTPRNLHRFRSEALGRGIPSADVERWLGLARPCADLSPEEDGPVVGRLGGPVLLPPDVPVPADDFTSMGRSYQMPYHLIADVDLAALPADATDLPMPPDGRLLLFAIPGLDGATGAAVYVPAGTDVEERRVEYRYDPDDHLASLDFDNELQGDLRLKPNVSLPNHEIADDEVTVDTAEHPRAEELREVWEETWGDERRVYKWSHLQIGGYASDAEGWGDPVVNCARETADPADLQGWALLAEWRPAMAGLEMATMYWAIRREDLAARRFGRVATTMYANP